MAMSDPPPTRRFARIQEELDSVCSDHEPLRVERKNGEAVVLSRKAILLPLKRPAYLLAHPPMLAES